MDKKSEDRAPVSAFVVTYNEEAQIGDCLDSLKFCDEVLLIDSFSEDRTIEIAKARGARIIQREWPGYKDQKAFGLKNTTYDWVINVDADERISDPLRDSILDVLKDYQRDSNWNGKPVGFYMNRVIFHLGRWWRRGGWYPEYRLRFFLKQHVTWGGTDPHEKVLTNGLTSKLSGELLHYSYNDLADQFNRLQRYSTLAAEEDFRAEKSVGIKELLLSPLVRMFKFYVVKQGFREGKAGLICAGAEGIYTFMKYAKLWDFHREAKANLNQSFDEVSDKLHAGGVR